MVSDKKNTAKTVAFGAMNVAIATLSLYMSIAIPTGNLGFYFIASMAGIVLLTDRAYTAAITAYIASALLAFLILPDKLPALLFAAVLGHYGIFRTFINDKMPKHKIMNAIVSVLYLDASATVAIWLASLLLSYNVTEAFSISLPIWAVIIVMQIAFLMYHVLYTMCAAHYVRRIHLHITRARR